MRVHYSNEIFIRTAVYGLFWLPANAGQSEVGHLAINFSTSLLLRQYPVLGPSVEVGE